MHIEYAPIHGDDSDEEEDESEAGNLQDGWEDDRGADEFPDEVSDFEGEDDVDNSWEEYDDCDFEDEEDLGDPVNEVRPLNCKITSSRSYGTLSTRTTRTRRTRKKKWNPPSASLALCAMRHRRRFAPRPAVTCFACRE